MVIELDAGMATKYLYDDYRATPFRLSTCVLKCSAVRKKIDRRLWCESSIESMCPTRYVMLATGLQRAFQLVEHCIMGGAAETYKKRIISFFCKLSFLSVVLIRGRSQSKMKILDVSGSRSAFCCVGYQANHTSSG